MTPGSRSYLDEGQFEDLRRRAEAYLGGSESDALPLDDLGRLLHELDLYQTELHMQNAELIEAKQEAEEARDLYADLYQHAPMGYVTLTENGLISRINAAAQKALDLRESNGLQTAFVRLVHRGDRGRFYRLLNARGPRRAGELRLKRKNGTSFPALVEVTDEKGEGDEPAGCRLGFMDISLRKEAEDRLKEAQVLAEERTEVLTESRAETERKATELAEANARLSAEIQERKEAEKKAKAYARKLELQNRELEEFAFVASHDLQEPLRKVYMFIEMLRENYSLVLDDRATDFIARALNSTRRMQSLIKALLDYSRIATRAVATKPVDLTMAVQDAVEDLEIHIRKKAGRVEVGELCTIVAEPDHMRQLFQNLIANGLKFQTRPDPVVKVSGTLLDENVEGNPLGVHAYRILVEDNGIGFDEKYLDRIWTPFQRLHGKTAFEGTGMGLAICRKIVEHHGGRITARSTPGEGSVFEVVLPVGGEGK